MKDSTPGPETPTSPTQAGSAKRELSPSTLPTPVKRECRAEPEDTPLRVQRVHKHALLPKRSSPLSAGFDVSAAESAVIPARGKAVVKTGLKIAVAPGYYGRIAPRSGLAVKKFIDVGAGVIDADYRGEVGIVLFNFGAEDFKVETGDRIAQLVLEKISMASVVEVESLEQTERGAGGFGSTGVKA